MEVRFGNYRLLAELGHGGMADVYLAVSEGPTGSRFGKLLVVKRMHAHLAEDPDFVAMFLDEARLAARLNHPNVVQAHEVGQVGDKYFIAMEFLDGQSLRRIQTRAEKTKLRVRELAYTAMSDVLTGLQYAHDLEDYDGSKLEVVHRDITPHNVFVTYEGQVKVVDFGIAKAANRAQETRHGIIKGKVRYMAPEQAAGRPVDRRVDIFAAGVMLWEIATGRRLWDTAPDLAVVHNLAANAIPSHPRDVDPSVPHAIDAICARALAFDPDDRYPSALEMRRDLEDAVGDTTLLTSRRELGPTVAALFKSDRDRLKTILEEQLSELSREATVTTLGSSLDSGQTDVDATALLTPGISGGTVVLPETAARRSREANPVVGATGTKQHAPSSTIRVAPPVVTSAPARQPPVHRPPERSRRGTLTILGVGALVAAAAIGLIAARGRVDGWREAAAAPTNVPQTSLSLSATPANAHFVIDDGPPSPNPFSGRLERDSRPHTVRIEAPDHQSETRTLDLNSDVVLVVHLVPTEPPESIADAATAPVASAHRSPTTTTPTKKPAPVRPAKTAAASAATPTPPPSATHTKKAPPVDTTDPWK